jgi:hypothetical protein
MPTPAELQSSNDMIFQSLIEGETGSVATNSGLRAYVGIAPELFAANVGFGTFMTAFYKDQRYDGDAFLHQQNPPHLADYMVAEQSGKELPQ